jgi:hypothetical protein
MFWYGGHTSTAADAAHHTSYDRHRHAGCRERHGESMSHELAWRLDYRRRVPSLGMANVSVGPTM